MRSSGHLDAVTSSGYIEGWAVDGERPFHPLGLVILSDGEKVAEGLAHRFRWDLADAGIGTGWCAFRLRISGSVSGLRRSTVQLLDADSGDELFQTSTLPLSEDHDSPLSSVEQVARADPTLVHEIDSLRGCDNAFLRYISLMGVEAFVRAAYVYVLGRPVDPSGLQLYSDHLNAASIAPFGLLKVLYESEEFRAFPRQLISPTEPGFAFQII